MTGTSPTWQRHRAARALAHHARDAADLAELLDILGLTAVEGRVPPDKRPAPEPPRHPERLDEACAGRLGVHLRAALPQAHRHAG